MLNVFHKDRPCHFQVVIDLILEMKELGHPSYVHLDPAKVKAQAARLPEHGVPPEVLQVIHEAATGKDMAVPEDKLQPQKAATPCDALQEDLAAAGATFAAQRPRTVVAEGRDTQTMQEVARATIAGLAEGLKPAAANKEVQAVEVRAGNHLADMFRPDYWLTTFPFNFKHATAEPDITKQHLPPDQRQQLSRRKRGNPRAPEVTMPEWAAAMQRQAASQFRRDWNFGPVLWNYLFRTWVNQQPNASRFVMKEEGSKPRYLSNKEIQEGINEIYHKLEKGTYRDVNGDDKAIKGDLMKLRYVPNLSQAARAVLKNAEARASKIPGTHEVRSTMRHQTHAYRVCHGVAIFLTFSPSERDTAIMLRMVRGRMGDPAIARDPCKRYYGRDKPDLEIDYMRLSPERLAEAQRSLSRTL